MMRILQITGVMLAVVMFMTGLARGNFGSWCLSDQPALGI